MAAEKYFPFRSVSGDRKYSAEDWAAYFALFLSDGVCYSSADRLKVVVNEGMKVRVITGAGFIAGRMYMLETDKTITLDTADGALNRIDRIVLRCDYTSRKMGVEVVKGSYSEQPTAPALTRNADIYELALADVYVAAGVISVTQSNITDQRLNTSLCGIVTGLIDQADTTEIFNQFSAYLEEFKQNSGEEFDAAISGWDKEFDTWFAEIKVALEENPTAELAARIVALEDGTKPAGKAAALTDEEAAKWQTQIDSIQTTSKATLSQAGWYRVAEYVGQNESHAKGSYGNSCKLRFKTNLNESFEITLESTNGNQSFYINSKKSSANRISKIRYAYEGSTAYIEIYYSGTDSCVITCDLNNPKDYYFKWNAINFIATSETVSGVTVTTTYDIPANAKPVTDLDLEKFNGVELRSGSILEKALAASTGVHTFKLYSGATDLPHSNYGYGMATVFKRTDESIVVNLWGYDSEDVNYRRIASNSYNGSAWNGWLEYTTTADLATALANYLTDDELYAMGIGSQGLYHSRITSERTLVNLLDKNIVVFFSNWTDGTNFPFEYGSGVIFPTADSNVRMILYGKGTNLKTFATGYASKSSGSWVVTWDEKASVADLAGYLPINKPTVTKSGTEEGGCLMLERSDNSTLSGSQAIEAHSDKMWFYERGGSFRGAFLDLINCKGVWSTEILHSNNYKNHALPKVAPTIESSGENADYGGQLFFGLGANSELNTGIRAENYLNTFRIMEVGGNARGAFLDLTKCANGGTSEIHHDGNSAKVVFTESDTTAPSDTTALWAHL